jgi:hypothetical protein
MARIILYISCPACKDDGYNTQKTYWQHNRCKLGSLYLDENANIYCSGCQHLSHLSGWAFSCPDGKHDFRVPTISGFVQAISVSSQLTNEAGQKWFMSVLQKIEV